MSALAEVTTLYDSNCRQLVETLRKNADDIESGKHGDCVAVVLVLLHDDEGVETADVFGCGKTDFWHSLGILQAGIAKLTKMLP